MTLKELIERSAEPGYVALDALADAGYVIVPKEPTLTMTNAADSLDAWEYVTPAGCWQAMIDTFVETKT